MYYGCLATIHYNIYFKRYEEQKKSIQLFLKRVCNVQYKLFRKLTLLRYRNVKNN